MNILVYIYRLRCPPPLSLHTNHTVHHAIFLYHQKKVQSCRISMAVQRHVKITFKHDTLLSFFECVSAPSTGPFSVYPMCCAEGKDMSLGEGWSLVNGRVAIEQSGFVKIHFKRGTNTHQGLRRTILPLSNTKAPVVLFVQNT